MNLLNTAVLLFCFSNAVSGASEVSFKEEVLPVLYQRCFSCHSEKKEKPKGGLLLDSAAEIRNSGVIETGRPDDSELFIRLSLPHSDEDFMPPLEGGGQPLSDTETELLRKWIEQGADMGDWEKFNHRDAPLPIDTTAPVEFSAMVNQINDWVSQYHQKQGTNLNPPVSDEVFLRRLYLDIGGRMPSPQETTAFLTDRDTNRRAKLISLLLDSEAYVSHTFNWKADQLRLAAGTIQGQPGYLYDQWVKDSIRSGMTYDDYVRSLITASGYLWTNGAVGFYLRDRGMPLDHMSNLSRVFLGTRIECAQCHDNPLEPVTQRDFYQMAAYTFGVSNMANPAGYSLDGVWQWPELKRMLDEQNADSALRNGVSRAISYLKRRTTDTEYELKFPDDYTYNKEVRRKAVGVRTLFGAEAPANIENRREAFADWMVSPRNPRFARNIANRLWKRVFGIGLIEPVDSLSVMNQSEYEDLIKLLTAMVIQLDFDERAFLKVLVNTQIYQAESIRSELKPGQAMDLRGPLLRRVSAEQAWDSLLALIVPGLDQRKSLLKYENSQVDPVRLRELTAMPAKEILERAKVEMAFRIEEREHKLWLIDQTKSIAAESDPVAAQKLKNELAKRRAEFTAKSKATGMAGRFYAPETDSRWKKIPKDYLRASELVTPIPLSHFLRQFGQSDRQEIDAFNKEPNSTHSLALMNGKLVTAILNDGSLLRRHLPAPDLDDESRIEAVYKAILTRNPNANEKTACMNLFETSKSPEADLIWALINSPEFLFIQ